MAKSFGKKGMFVEMKLGNIILTIISFILIFSFMRVQLQQAEEEAADTICKDSLALKAQYIVNPLRTGERHPVPSLCISDREIVIDCEGKDVDEIKHELLERMARVWWVFAEGKYKAGFFSKRSDLLWLLGGFDKCFRYYIVEFENLDGKIIQASDITTYARKNKYSDKNVIFANYFEKCPGGDCFFYILDDVVEGKKYAIIYADLAKKNWKKLWASTSTHGSYNGLFFADLNRPIETQALEPFKFPITSKFQCEFVEGEENV